MEIGAENTPFVSIGGDEQVRALVDAFYDHMDVDPEFAGIRAFHKPDLSHTRDVVQRRRRDRPTLTRRSRPRQHRGP